jgi:methyltransferase family protein
LTRLEEKTTHYQNTGAYNDALHQRFTSLTATDELLNSHRAYVKANSLGFGDDAFHYMWDLIVDQTSRGLSPKYLEIGVYKGQVISLWQLLLRRLERSGQVFALGPFRGNPPPSSPLVRRLLRRLSPSYRDRESSSNFYENHDYEALCAGLFGQFDLDWLSVTKWRGLSSNPSLQALARAHHFDIVYIDGDHRYKIVLADLQIYAPLLRTGGFLVVDDSGCDLPGETFWKGYPSVSKAVATLSPTQFRNVLNVGHNRVYERL